MLQISLLASVTIQQDGSMQPIQVLLDRSATKGEPLLSPALRTLYGGDLSFPPADPDKPHVVVNFVTTLDGVASFQIPGQSGGGEISGFDDCDRFIMALLRATTDAVMFGSGSLHGDPGHIRTAEFIYPSLRDELRALRTAQPGRAVHPLNVVLTASGRIDLQEPTFHTPDLTTVIMTTEAGLERLKHDHGRALKKIPVRTAGAMGDRVAPDKTLQILRQEFGVRQLLHEGGPTLFGQFLADNLVDELFLSSAPQIAGRNQLVPRPGIVDRFSFSPGDAPWFDLIDLRLSKSHLYARYRRKPASA
jgi:riboflavin biosynthesis pyrimidine reductase